MAAGAQYHAALAHELEAFGFSIDRIGYMLMVNPIFIMVWWCVWIIPLTLGFVMYLKDSGQVWQRTEKIDANNTLVRSKLDQYGVLRHDH